LELCNPHRPSLEYMHQLYNSNDYTIDNTLSLNSNINWVTLKFDMDELFMSDSLVKWLIIVGSCEIDRDSEKVARA